MKRRTLLIGCALAPLAACANMSSGITLTEEAWTEAKNIIAGFEALSKTSLGSEATKVMGYVGEAMGLLATLNVGQVVAPTSITNIFTDLNLAVTAAASVPGLTANPYFMAISTAITVLSGLWSISIFSVTQSSMPRDQADKLLGALPTPQALTRKG
jgi:hypothetical protein